MIKYLLLLILASFMVSHYAAASKLVKACGHHDYAPWNWFQDHEITGLCADITTELYRRIGYEVDLSYIGPWKRCQQMISAGDIDVNICSFKNSARKEYSEFMSRPIATNENALFVNYNSGIEFENLNNLKGLNIGLVRGVSLGTQLDNFLANHSKIITVETYSRLFKMLLLGRVDALIFGRESGRYYLTKMSLTEQIIDLPKPVIIGDLYISISKHSQHIDTIQALNNVFLSSDYQKWQAELFHVYHERQLKKTVPLQP